MGIPPWASRELWFWVPALEAAVRVLRLTVNLGGFACPPDEPEGAEDWDLQHDKEKEDWPEPLHRAQCRETAQRRKASTCASSRPMCVSVGTRRVGCSRRSAQSKQL